MSEKLNEKNRKVAIYTTLEVLAMFIICLFAGAFDFVNLTFTWTEITTWKYWREVIQKMVMYSAALLCGYFFKVEKEELSNKEYYSCLDLYRELLKSKLESFTTFIESFFNPETKKRFIKIKAENRLAKLDKHASDDFRIEFNKAMKSGDIENYKWSSKKMQKYAEARIKYTKMSSKEYIEDNWEFISVKYPKVSPYSFTYSVRNTSVPNAEYRVDNKVAADMSKGVGNKLLSVLCASLVLALFAIDPNKDQLINDARGFIAILAKYVGRCILIATNFATGLYTGKQIFADNFILPLQNRIRILQQYLNWTKEHNEKTYADEIMEQYRNQKELSERLEKQKKELAAQIEEAQKIKY